jgi:hypothetical protein
MKNMSLAALAGALLLALPALADTTPPTGAPSAEQQCRMERGQMGVDTFRTTYGTNKNHRNAFSKCVSKRTSATDQNESEAHSNAATDCKTEQAGDPAAFAGKYGTNKNGANAFGKCVSQQAQEKTAAATRQDIQADVNAAQACKAERKPDPAAFALKYGTNANHRNAFGKCVSQHAKAEQEQESGTS